jgi:hypothetical protein
MNGRVQPWAVLRVVAVGDETLPPLVLHHPRGLHGFLVVVLLLHLRL